MGEENKYISKDNKELLVKKNWCIGKVSEDGTPIANINVCNDLYENLYIGLLTVDEVLIPSLDNNCTNLFDGSCSNYNYFAEINVGWTLTTGLKTHTVFSANEAEIEVRTASLINTTRPVININSDILYKNGDGTQDNPYIIGK